MLISKEKYHNDISAAYTRGLEQGFELARKLKQVREGKIQEPSSPPDTDKAEETPLLLRQLVDIAERKGITLR
jgi:hypothetical protein